MTTNDPGHLSGTKQFTFSDPLIPTRQNNTSDSVLKLGLSYIYKWSEPLSTASLGPASRHMRTRPHTDNSLQLMENTFRSSTSTNHHTDNSLQLMENTFRSSTSTNHQLGSSSQKHVQALEKSFYPSTSILLHSEFNSHSLTGGSPIMSPLRYRAHQAYSSTVPTDLGNIMPVYGVWDKWRCQSSNIYGDEVSMDAGADANDVDLRDDFGYLSLVSPSHALDKLPKDERHVRAKLKILHLFDPCILPSAKSPRDYQRVKNRMYSDDGITDNYFAKVFDDKNQLCFPDAVDPRTDARCFQPGEEFYHGNQRYTVVTGTPEPEVNIHHIDKPDENKRRKTTVDDYGAHTPDVKRRKIHVVSGIALGDTTEVHFENKISNRRRRRRSHNRRPRTAAEDQNFMASLNSLLTDCRQRVEKRQREESGSYNEEEYAHPSAKRSRY